MYVSPDIRVSTSYSVLGGVLGFLLSREMYRNKNARDLSFPDDLEQETVRWIVKYRNAGTLETDSLRRALLFFEAYLHYIPVNLTTHNSERERESLAPVRNHFKS